MPSRAPRRLANIAVLRRRALDVVRRDTSKGSLSIKFKRAGWDDPAIGITWPVQGDPILSGKDAVAPFLADLDSPFVFEGLNT